MKLRLDKLIASLGRLSRSECGKAVRSGRVFVNGKKATSPSISVDPEADTVLLDGERVVYREFLYLMMNKPDGYVSATEDGADPTVLTLLPEELQKRNLFPCGRLDKHTLGLMLLTDDGPLGHRLLSPKSHVEKQYRFRTKFPVSDEDLALLEAGVSIEVKDAQYLTRPAQVILTNQDRTEGRITLTEGKYHQIKLMFRAVHNQIVFLERQTFGPLSLDPTLGRGEWRYLTEAELSALKNR